MDSIGLLATAWFLCADILLLCLSLFLPALAQCNAVRVLLVLVLHTDTTQYGREKVNPLPLHTPSVSLHLSLPFYR
eukprot:gene7322-5158_t